MFREQKLASDQRGRAKTNFIEEYLVWLKEQGSQKVAEFIDVATRDSRYWKVLEEIAETAAENPSLSREQIRAMFTHIIPKIKALADESN
jgi:hypothetical protein